MKVEDVKKINHHPCILKFKRGEGAKIIRGVDDKPIALVVPFLDHRQGTTGKHIRIVLDGYASRDDLASAMATLITAIMQENPEFEKRMFEDIK